MSGLKLLQMNVVTHQNKNNCCSGGAKGGGIFTGTAISLANVFLLHQQRRPYIFGSVTELLYIGYISHIYFSSYCLLVR